MTRLTNTLIVLWVVLFSTIPYIALAQSDSTVNTVSPFVLRMQQVGRNEAIKSKEKFDQNRIEFIQSQHLVNLQKTNQELALVLNTPYDTTRHREKNQAIQRDLDLATAQMKEAHLQEQSLRNITVSEAIVEELLIEIRKQQTNLSEYAQKLFSYKRTIDSIYSDSTIYLFNNDSAKAMRYLQKLAIISKDISPIEQTNEALLIRLEQLQNETDDLAFQIRSQKNELSRLNKLRFATITEPDIRSIQDADGSIRSFQETIEYSHIKEKRVLLYYLQSKVKTIFILALLWGLLVSLFHYAKQHVEDAPEAEQLPTFLILQSPGLSAALLVTCLGQFIFINPPFIFSLLLWSISGFILLFLLRGYIHARWWQFAWVGLFLSLLAGADNLILQYSDTDRWIILALSILGVLFGTTAVRTLKRIDTRESRMRYFLYFLIACELGSIMANVLGRWNLAKILLICGYGGMLTGVWFLWVIRLINETLQVIGFLSNQTSKKFLNFSALRLGSKAPRTLYYLLVLGWLNLLARHFYTYKQITQPIQDFFTADRTIGSYTFSIGGLIIFILVLGTAMAISKILSLFAEEEHDGQGSSPRASGRPNAGSWMLLIRICVICIGFFLALASAGIPLDRIAIVLGGLSVGIGLGLQGLVSNLISGLILAFEKPVQVGDTVDINNKSGRMRSIGFRSSSIQLTDGSSLIIPNGDLLNQHLINWSKGNNMKKAGIVLCIGLDQNLQDMQALLLDLAKQDPRIVVTPSPQVNALAFQPKGIDVELNFWTRHLRELDDVKSDLIGRIQTELKVRKISLPMPIQLVQIADDPKPNPTEPNP